MSNHLQRWKGVRGGVVEGEWRAIDSVDTGQHKSTRHDKTRHEGDYTRVQSHGRSHMTREDMTHVTTWHDTTHGTSGHESTRVDTRVNTRVSTRVDKERECDTTGHCRTGHELVSCWYGMWCLVLV